MRLPWRPRFGDVIERQLDLFTEQERPLLTEIQLAAAAYRQTDAGEAEERYGEYMDLVEQAEEELLALRDRYAETMAARERLRYEREFTRAAERRLPSLSARRAYERAIGGDLA